MRSTQVPFKINRQTLSKLALALVLFVSTLLASSQARGQVNSNNAAPRIISTTPAQREVVGPETMVQIVFDQSMNRSSVEAAWSITPQVSGQFVWTDDTSLTFKPDAPLKRGETYTAKLGAEAQSATGAALGDAFALAFAVRSNLSVSQTVPTDGAVDIEATGNITIVFDRPVVPLMNTTDQQNLPQPITIEPAVEGEGQWVGTSIYVFKPKTAFAGATTYTVTVNGDLKDIDGTPMTGPYAFKFTTLAPRILDMYPYDGSQVQLDATFSVTFNQPMDENSLRTALTIVRMDNGAPVAGTLTLDPAKMMATFKPASLLELGIMYRFAVDGSAKSVNGQAGLSNPTAILFSTLPYPKVVRSYPANGEMIELGQGVSVEYNTQMDPDSFKGKVKVSPEPKNLQVYGSQYTSISFTMEPSTTYTVTIEAGVKDIYGNQVKEPFSFSFTTKDARPAFGVAQLDSILLTSAYKPSTTLAIAAINISSIDIVVARVEGTDALRSLNYYDPGSFPPLTPFRKFSVPITAPRNTRVEIEIPLAEDGKTLPLGIYIVRVSAPEVFYQTPGDALRYYVLVVSNTAITLKTSTQELFAWVTDFKTGEPLANQTVTFYNSDTLTEVGKATTDAQGVARTAYRQSNDYEGIIAIASGETTYGVASNRWSKGFPDGQNITYGTPTAKTAYLYTDQPVYRPGRLVYFRGIVRNREDVNYTIPTANYNLLITDPNGQQVYTQPVTLNAYGAFSGQFELPQGAVLGNYYFALNEIGLLSEQTIQTVNFQVAEFRPPEFLTTVTTEGKEYGAGDTITATIDAKFLFGGAVSGGNVQWVVTANQTTFNYTGPGSYIFPGFRFWYWFDRSESYNRQVASGSGQLDDKGQLVITIPADLAGSQAPQIFTIEANVTDISNQLVSGRVSVTVHPASVYIGLQPNKYVGRAGDPMSVDLIVVDWASQPIANQKIKMKVTRLEWAYNEDGNGWEQKREVVTEGEVITAADGKGSFSFTPAKAGTYEIEASTRDPRERIAVTTTNVWVQGPNAGNWGGASQWLLLVSDAQRYQVGQTAEILITSPFEGPVKALITVERAGVMKTDIVTVDSSYTYQLPLEDSHAPNVYVAVTLMRGGDSVNSFPEQRQGLINLLVETPKQLKVQAVPSVKQAAPGEKVRFDLTVTDKNGQPVQAELGASLSDVATLSVGVPNSQPIFDFFWSLQGLSVMTSHMLDKLIDPLKPQDASLPTNYEAAGTVFAAVPTVTMADGGAPATDGVVSNEVAERSKGAENDKAASSTVTPRTNFIDTPLWQASVVTDAAGKASVEVTLPDNLTTWRLDVRAVTLDTAAGDTTFEIISTRPLLVRPATPRFFVVGDQAELAVVVNNNSESDLTVDVTLDAKGLTLQGQSTQTVQIPKDGRVRVAWQGTVQDVSAVDVVFTARGGEYVDASKPQVGLGPDKLLPVYRYLAPDYASTAGTLTEPGTRTEAIMIPAETAAPTGNLTVKVQSSLAATTLDGLDYLKNYPYQCLEQTVSRFLPNIITYRAMQKLGIADPKLKANLDEAVTYALKRIQSEQKPDGGWGWYYRDESNPLTTAYALWGLTEAKAADYQVDPVMISNASMYLLTTLHSVDDLTDAYLLNRQAFVLWVLSKTGNTNITQVDQLFVRREKMNLYARAFLAQIYHSVGQADKVNTLLSDFQNAAIVSATGTHWEEDYRDWWNWGSDVRSTAIILDTLITLTPDSPLLPNVVRWLMVARKGDVWETTQETAWAVMALTNWMYVSGELKADYTYTVKVNDTELGNGVANQSTLKDTQILRVEIDKLIREQANKLAFEHSAGAGNLYYTATLTLNQPVELIKPTNRGLNFTRTYYVNNKPVTSAKVGNVITVVLEITAEHDLYYVNIEDPIPAGTEAIDRSLQTTSQIGQRPELSRDYDYWRYGWGWWWFSNTELRTEKVLLNATYLPRGSYSYVYQIQATTPGTYKVIPPNGNEFYFPEVFGRGVGSLFTVTAE